jgi:hypothetical protein
VVVGYGMRSEVLHVKHAELAHRRSLSIKTGYQILTKMVTQESEYILGQRSPWSPANANWNREPDIEEELEFFNADTLESL